MKKNIALKKIVSEAKQLQKKDGNRKSWTKYVQQASALYRSGKLGAYKVIEKGETKKTPIRKTVQVQRTKKGLFKGVKTVGDVSSNMYQVRDMLERDLRSQIAQVKHHLTNGVKRNDRIIKQLNKNIISLRKQLLAQNRLINQNLR